MIGPAEFYEKCLLSSDFRKKNGSDSLGRENTEVLLTQQQRKLVEEKGFWVLESE